MPANNRSYKNVLLLFERLQNNSKTSATSSKLNKINTICKNLVDKSITPSIALVVKLLIQDGVKISSQTIYNKRANGNPYRQLIDAWIDCANLISSKKPIIINDNSKMDFISCIFDENDLANIPDPVIRYRITLLLGELKGLRNQLNIARELSMLPSIKPAINTSKTQISNISNSFLSNYDFSILNKFLLGTYSLGFNEEGSLISKYSIKRGEILSEPGLREALKKIVLT